MATETEIPTGEFSTDWKNYGDASPEVNGGRFVRWDEDSEEFDMVEINRAGAISPDYADEPGTYYVRTRGVQLSDIWVDGDPDNGFTDSMKSILESFSDEHHKEAPGGPPFIKRIRYYVADMLYQPGHTPHEVDEGDFEDVLASYGVDDWE